MAGDGSLYAALISGMPSDDKDLLEASPGMAAALKFAQSPNPAPQNNMQAFLMPLLKGIISSALYKDAKHTATEKAYGDVQDSGLLSALKADGYTNNIGPVADGDVYSRNLEEPGIGKILAEYSGGMPQDWTPKKGRSDAIALALMAEDEKEKTKLREAIANQMALVQQKYDLENSPSAIARQAEAKALFSEAEARGKRLGEGGALGVNPKLEEATDSLRKEFSGLPEVKNFSIVKSSADALSKALADKSAVSDQELVRRTIQMIEPGMAVREGEQKAVALSQSIPEEWKGALSKALSGGTALDDGVRAGIRRIAERAYNAQSASYEQARKFYEEQAQKKGLDPSRISYIGVPPTSEKIFGQSAASSDPAAFIQQLKASGVSKEEAKRLFAEQFGG